MDSEGETFVKVRIDSPKCDELEIDRDPITCNAMAQEASETGVDRSKYSKVGSVSGECLIKKKLRVQIPMKARS